MIAPAPPMRDQVFISYSPADRPWLDMLRKHLAPLERRGLLQLWDDTRIQAGERGADKIAAALRRAKVAVLLVSADYFASDEIAKGELAMLLQVAEAGALRLLWVPVRASLHQLSELAPYKAAHAPDQPLAQLSEAEQEAALVRVCQQILSGQDDAVTPAQSVFHAWNPLFLCIFVIFCVIIIAKCYRFVPRELVQVDAGIGRQPADDGASASVSHTRDSNLRVQLPSEKTTIGAQSRLRPSPNAQAMVAVMVRGKMGTKVYIDGQTKKIEQPSADGSIQGAIFELPPGHYSVKCTAPGRSCKHVSMVVPKTEDRFVFQCPAD